MSIRKSESSLNKLHKKIIKGEDAMSTVDKSVIKNKLTTNTETVYWCRIITLIFSLLPIVAGYIGAMPAALFIGIIFIIITFGSVGFVEKNAGAILFFSIYCIMSCILRRVVAYMTIYNSVNYVVSAFTMLYFVYNEKPDNIKKLFVITLVLMMITETTTIIGTRIYPEAPRFLITDDAANSQRLYTYTRLNIGGFSMVYAMPGLLVNLYILTKKKIINKVFFIIFTVLAFLFAFSIQFTMAIVLTMISAMVIIVSFNKPKKFIRNGIILVVIGIISINYISMFLANVSTSVDSQILNERFNDASMMLEGEKLNEKSAGNARMEAYEETISLIKDHFILGGRITENKSGGGHSSFGDFIAAFGILGWLVLIGMLYFMYKSIYKGTKKTEYYQAMVFAQIMFVLPLVVNNINSASYYWFMFGTSIATVYLSMKNKDEKTDVTESEIEILEEPRKSVVR